jgi:hypothetical protein
VKEYIVRNTFGIKEEKRYWKKMINNLEGNVRRKYTFRKTKKERWKAMKHKSIKRDNNYKLQKNHINYCLNLSNISNEVWKRKWKRKILRGHKSLHPLKRSNVVQLSRLPCEKKEALV